ncbi:hypothetical protein D7W89_004680, partial [Escherichia coli]|nr:hypothetical protein [Escherichia coli]
IGFQAVDFSCISCNFFNAKEAFIFFQHRGFSICGAAWRHLDCSYQQL